MSNNKFFFSFNLLIIFFNLSYSLACARYITVKQQYISYTDTIPSAIISTYGRMLSIIKKVFQNLVEEYQSIGKSLQNLVEGQKRNTAQLVRIGAIVDWKQSLKKSLQCSNKKSKEEDEEDEEFEEELEEIQEKALERTLLSAFYQNIVSVLFLY